MIGTAASGDPDDAAVEAHREDLAALYAAGVDYPVALVPMSAEQGDLPALTDRLTADAIEKIDAGAELVYALYHAGKGFWTRRDHPQCLLKAYVRAQAAYGVGRAGQKRAGQKDG